MTHNGAPQPGPQLFPARLDRHAFAAMTDREFDLYCELTEQLLADAGPQATVADALQALPELEPPF
ncbi:hypothetical protein [Pseudonocardia oroxyli]|uniref:Uncharacterized protein n=1 Tax=Pseudonocardia oroxyli TaxID=366584 RepID=A0A1G7IS52_PSEOR|nr:hypothetical protein [Pseudonocardia oroxyli]SDF15562.1 hypothetical protein SAMN05216377_103390 [Pseudonocardia oroxyli]